MSNSISVVPFPAWPPSAASMRRPTGDICDSDLIAETLRGFGDETSVDVIAPDHLIADWTDATVFGCQNHSRSVQPLIIPWVSFRDRDRAAIVCRASYRSIVRLSDEPDWEFDESGDLFRDAGLIVLSCNLACRVTGKANAKLALQSLLERTDAHFLVTDGEQAIAWDGDWHEVPGYDVNSSIPAARRVTIQSAVLAWAIAEGHELPDAITLSLAYSAMSAPTPEASVRPKVTSAAEAATSRLPRRRVRAAAAAAIAASISLMLAVSIAVVG